MITVRARKQAYEVDADYADFVEELNNQRTPYIQVNEELIRKSEITGVRKSGVVIPDNFIEAQTQPEKKRMENLFVYNYMKAYIPRHMKQMGRKLQTDEIRAIIAEARISYADDVL
jgi:hypothetical protein